ncbi:MAG TPA: TonB C-terminal domain-containing protein [Bryobacteraceae bacterium]|jgi:outer membrane biosynthesis protein TonB|nr:TonB C-terminal domain-containing protein [Bryobacteraceae bacterium]
MTANVLLRPDPKGRSFAFAFALHASLFGTIFLVNWLHSKTDSFGDPNAGGASIGVEVVDKIPIPHQGMPNPLAAQTESEAPQEPAKPVDRAEKEVAPPDAVKINLHKDKKQEAKEESTKRRFRPFDQLESNQLKSKTPQAVSSPLFSQMPGSGRVGLGANTTLGTQYGAYAAQIQDLISRNWHTNDVTAQVAPPVIASFDLMKDGSIRNLTIVQGSRIPSLDFSVRRAIEGVTLPPLPPGYPHDTAKCEFTFELKK